MSLIPVSRPIDGRGMKRERRMVSHIQKQSRRDRKMAAAKEKRERRAAKRADPNRVIVLNLWPSGGIAYHDPSGCYVQGGVGFPGGKYQMVVVGDLVASVDDYRRALEAWLGRAFRIESQGPMEMPNLMIDDERNLSSRSFLSIILEPEGD